jgi:hypothetical protein
MRLLPTISLALWLVLWSMPAQAESVRILVQSSPLAGSQYYAVGEFWGELRVGDPLTLIREPDNRHDRHAIRVEWRGHKLGYVPRAENRAVAAALDSGDKLVARIARLTDHANPWRRVEFEVFAEL